MLVLSRKEMESVRLGNGVVVHVRAIRGNRVVLGFDAPQDVRVMRAELPDFDSDQDDLLRQSPSQRRSKKLAVKIATHELQT